MENDPEQDTLTAQNVRKQFDHTLGQHIERLIGSRYGLEALPLNLTTISCITILTERENKINSYPSTSFERYTHETLLKELSEIGLDPDEDLKMALQDMIQKGYIDVDDNGRFFARKPTMSMAKVLDHTFPKMPGMNFIAYFVQTMDEAQSGRKNLDSAISQFNQTLKMQGVSLLKQKTQPELAKAPGRPVKPQAKLMKTEAPHISASGLKIISSNGNLGQVEIREIFADQDEPQEKSEEIDEVIEVQESDIPQEENMEEQDEKVEAESSYAEPEMYPERLSGESSEPSSEMQDLTVETAPTDTSLENLSSSQEAPLTALKTVAVVKETDLSTEPEMEGAETKTVEVDEALQQTETKHETEIVPKQDFLEKPDDIIEKQIVALEEDLAMQCPICKKGTIQSEKTATNKIYYKCSNKDCNFISWGKPYHIVCPQCQNPFLVETCNRNGKPILKCPRATCRYWQKLPGEIAEKNQEKAASQAQGPDKLTAISRKPRRRVVKRRVVRRKR